MSFPVGIAVNPGIWTRKAEVEDDKIWTFLAKCEPEAVLFVPFEKALRKAADLYATRLKVRHVWHPQSYVEAVVGKPPS